jgi:hypothetical protein
MKVCLPNFIPIWYENNPQSGYYTKTICQPTKRVFLTMPYELRVERTQVSNIRLNAEYLIRSKEKKKNGSYCLLTGLIRLPDTNFFVGNNARYNNSSKITELIIFCFSKDNSRLRTFYFPNFDKVTIKDRVDFAIEIIPHLLLNKSN